MQLRVLLDWTQEMKAREAVIEEELMYEYEEDA